MNERVRILVWAEQEQEGERLRRLLMRRPWEAEVKVLTGLFELIEGLSLESWDVVVLEDGNEGRRLEHVLDAVGSVLDGVPIIGWVGDLEEDRALALGRRGVGHWVWKDRMAGLLPAVESALSLLRRRTGADGVEASAGGWMTGVADRKAMFDSMASTVAVLDANGTIVAVNEAWRRFAAENPLEDGTLPRNCGIGVNYLSVCLTRSGPALEEARVAHDGICQVLERKSSGFRMEYSCHSPREKRWFLMSVVPLSDSQGGAVISHLNITRLRDVERERDEANARFQALLDGSPDGTLLVDKADGRVLYGSRTLCRMLGYRKEDLVQRRLAELLPDVETGEGWAGGPRGSQEGPQFLRAVRLIHHDGTVLAADIGTAEVEVGGRSCVLSSIRDRTALEQVEERDRIQRGLMKALASAERLEEGLRLCLDAALRAEGFDCGGFYLFEAQDQALHLAVHSGLGDDFVEAVARFGLDTPQWRLVAQGQVVYNRVADLPVCKTERERREGLQCLAVVPLLHRGQLLGCLNMASHTQEVIPLPAKHLFEAIAAEAAQAIARLRAEEARRESEANLRNLFETIEDLIFVATSDGKVLFGNGAAGRKLGYRTEELRGMRLQELHPAEVRAEATEILAAMLRGDRSSCPLPLLRKDGSLLPVETRAWRGRWSGEPCLFGLCKDLSAEQEAQQRFERLFRKNPLPMSIQSLPDRRLLDVNEAWLGDLGYRREEVLGKTSEELGIHPGGEPWEGIALNDREPIGLEQVERCYRARDGRLLEGRFSGEILVSQGRRSLLTVMIDLTEQKRMERQQHLALDVLRILNESRTLPQANRRILEAIRQGAGLDGVGIRLRPGSVSKEVGGEMEQWVGWAGGGEGTEAGQLGGDGEGGTMVAIPIRGDQGEVGVLHLLDRGARRFTEDAIRMFEGLASSFGVALGRWRAHEEVVGSQKTLRALFDAIPESLFLMETGGRVLQANDAFAKRFGSKVEDVLGQNLLELVPGHLVEVRKAWVEEALRNGRPVIHEERWDDRWLRHHYCPVRQAGSDNVQLVVLAVDITDRRRMEQALVEGQALTEGVFNSVSSHIAVLDGAGTIVAVNAAWKRFHGGDRVGSGSEGFGVGVNYLEYCRATWESGAEDSRVACEGIQGVLEGRLAVFTMEYPSHAPAERRWFQLTATPFGAGRRGGVVSHADITGRKLAEEELRKRLELQEKLARVAMTVPGVICEVRIRPDGSMCMPFATPALVQICGVAPTEVRDDLAPGLARLEASDRQRLLERLVESGQTLKPWRDTVQIRHPERGDVWVEATAVPRRDADGGTLLHGFLQDVTEWKRLEREREAAFIKYQTLFESFPLGITVAAPDGRILESNRRSEELLGLTQDEQHQRRVGGPEWTVLRPDGSPMPPEEFASTRALLEQRVIRNVEMGIVRPGGGQPVWISATAAPVPLAGVGVVVTYADISELVQSRQALEAEATWRRMLIEGSRDGIVLLDENGKVFEANRRFAEMLGYTSEEVRELHVWDWDRTWTREQVLEAIQSLGPGGQVFETRHWRKDGSIREMSLSNSAAVLQGRKLVFCVCRDITERKRTEESLHESLLFRREAEKIARLGAWKVSPETDFLYWTEGVYEIVGVPAATRLGLKEGLAYFDPESVPAIEAALSGALKEGAPFSIEARLTTASGEKLWTEVRGLGRVVERGQSYVMGTFQDITARKRWEESMVRDRMMTAFLLELHQRAPHMTDRELYDYVLERAVQVTESAIGFFHQVSEDEKTILLTTWNREALNRCQAEFNSHYPIAEAGNWVECIRQQKAMVFNDYAHSPHRRGLPDGHAPLTRFMSIPVIQEGRTRIIFGVGNKGSDYNDGDVARLQLVANELHKLMTQRGTEGRLRQLSQAVEQSPVGIFITDRTGQVEYVNPCFTASTGLTREDLQGDRLGRFLGDLSDVDGRKGAGVVDGVLRGRSWAGEIQTRNGQGETCWEIARVSPITDASGVVTHVLGIREDITERKRAVEAMRLSEERYRTLVETSADWIWEVDRNGRYVFASPRVETILGYKPDEVVGRTPFDFMPPEESARVSRRFEEHLRGALPIFGLENVNRHKDGRLVVLETNAVPILSAEGEVFGYRGTDRDITGRRRLEEQLRQAQKLEAVGQLAGGVAHDFNNILAAILMNFELLREDPSLSPAARESLKELDAEARRGAGVTRQLLMFSRRSILDVRRLNLNEVVENLLKMLRRLIGERVALEFTPLAEVPEVQADPGMMEQVLMNLVVNARDAMPRGGRVTITTRREVLEGAAVLLNPNRRSGCFACLTVTDTGVGMDAQTLEQIFEPFFTTKEAGKGTGLGLATVHGIIGQHQGWIEVESTVGQGSAFRVYLPCSAGLENVEVKGPSLDLRALRGAETILLVEDEDSVRRSLGQLLKMLGYRVLEASDSRQALGLWEAERGVIALLWTDMVMPGEMTGMELAERLFLEKPELKVIISSGYSDEIVRQGLPADPRITFLPKPFDVQSLGTVLRASLRAEAG